MTEPNLSRVPKPHRWKRRLLLAGCVLAAGPLLAAAGGLAFWRASLPETSGAVALSGLRGKVEAIRDVNGVPHIFADGLDDAWRALGYLHAQDRFFQMEMQRRAGQGRLAEVVGKDALPLDKLNRTLGLYRLAEANYAALSPDWQAALNAYAGGVNAWLDAHRTRLPLEFHLLNIAPERWKPADSLVWGKLMAWQLSANYRAELTRARLAQGRSEQEVEALFPKPSGDAPTTVRPDFAPPINKNGAKDKKSGFAPEFLRPLAAVFDRLALAVPDAGRGASNEWVVAGARTTTGKPLLANDPHLGLETPVLWYLARIVTPDITLTGATVPGMPVFLLGQNGHIAWGFTTTNSDVQDLFVETLAKDDPDSYVTPKGAAKFAVREETVFVKDGAPVTLRIRATRHGPVISDLEEGLADSGQVVALSFTGLDENDTTSEALRRINLAQNWAEFQNALKLYQTPPQNIMMADRDGHIGFTAAGVVPVRKQGNGRFPVNGASGAYDWIGFVPFTYWPRTYDPAGGALLNANNAVVGGFWPYWLGRDWDMPYRALRIEALLKATPQHDIASFEHILADTVSLAAHDFLPFLRHLETQDALETKALELLRGWDGAMDSRRPEPLIFAWWLRQMNKNLVIDKFGDAAKQMGPFNASLLLAMLNQPQKWCPDGAGGGDCAPVVRQAFAETLQELSRRYGDHVAGWRWGDEHVAPMDNRVLRHIPLFNEFFGQAFSSDGDFFTVNRGGDTAWSDDEHPLRRLHGAGYRAIYDLADPDNSRFISATGQSAHPLSPFYANLLPLWRDGQHIRITGTREELRAENAGVMVFEAKE